MKTPRTLQEAIAYFADPDRGFEYAVRLRWPDGKIICPRCSSDQNYFIKTRKLWLCRGCERQFTIKVNTIFEDSPVALDKWMVALWMLVNCKNGVSSMEIHRSIGVTQKTAWFMLQRLRTALNKRTFDSTSKLGGPDSELEADETFIGGTTANMQKSRRLKVDGLAPLCKAFWIGTSARFARRLCPT
jgi:transposase-like protein